MNQNLIQHWKNRSLKLCHIGYEQFFKTLQYKGIKHTNYIVSYDGFIFSKSCYNQYQKLKINYDKDGYIKFSNFERIHRIIYESFYGEIEKGKYILHKDDNKTNNCLNNLYCGTHQDNMNDRYKNNMTTKGERNARSKLTSNQVIDICKLILNKTPIKEIAQKYNVSDTCIYHIKNKRRWVHLYK